MSDPVTTDAGKLSGVTLAVGRARLQGHPVRRAAGGRAALEGAAAGGQVGRRAEGGAVRQRLRAAVAAAARAEQRHRGPARFAEDQRRLPVSERLDVGRPRRRAAAGDGVDLRRRLHRGRRVDARTTTARTWRRRASCCVTFNYRVGAFGFFSHPELTKESGRNASGNQALADCIAVLRWVKTNIAAFGGDPNNVTIFGESAGAAMVGGLVGSPVAKGLFHRAIAESGAWMGLGMGADDAAARAPSRRR